MGVCHYESDIGGNSADIANMVADSLELEQNRSHHERGGRDFDFRGSFDRLAERGAMRETGIPGYALGQEHAFMDRQVLKELLGPLVGVKHSELEIEDRLTSHGKA